VRAPRVCGGQRQIRRAGRRGSCCSKAGRRAAAAGDDAQVGWGLCVWVWVCVGGFPPNREKGEVRRATGTRNAASPRTSSLAARDLLSFSWHHKGGSASDAGHRGGRFCMLVQVLACLPCPLPQVSREPHQHWPARAVRVFRGRGGGGPRAARGEVWRVCGAGGEQRGGCGCCVGLSGVCWPWGPEGLQGGATK